MRQRLSPTSPALSKITLSLARARANKHGKKSALVLYRGYVKIKKHACKSESVLVFCFYQRLNRTKYGMSTDSMGDSFFDSNETVNFRRIDLFERREKKQNINHLMNRY